MHFCSQTSGLIQLVSEVNGVLTTNFNRSWSRTLLFVITENGNFTVRQAGSRLTSPSHASRNSANPIGWHQNIADCLKPCPCLQCICWGPSSHLAIFKQLWFLWSSHTWFLQACAILPLFILYLCWHSATTKRAYFHGSSKVDLTAPGDAMLWSPPLLLCSESNHSSSCISQMAN